MDDLAKIATQLSEAQKRALLWLEPGEKRERVKGDPSEASLWALGNIRRGDPWKEVARVCYLVRHENGEKRPGRMWPPRLWSLTEAGLRVRALLQEKD